MKNLETLWVQFFFSILPVQAANPKYVFKMALSWSAPSNSAELKLGQNIHKNIVPTIANISDVYDDPSILPALFWSILGRIIKLTAKPKYAPNACTVMEPPTSVT